MAPETRVAVGRLETLQIYKVLQCVHDLNKDQIEKLTTLGVPDLINLTEPRNGYGALHQAAEVNNVDMCKFLLSLGAQPDVQDFKGCTPAMKAAELGHDLVLEVLAKAHASMTIVNKEGKGILFYCISPTKRHLRCFQIALDGGADVNNKTKGGIPVFLAACEQARECKEMCLTLLERGAKAYAYNPKTSRTALMEAAREGALDVVRSILKKGGNVNAFDKQRYHAVHFAAKGGFFEILMVLSAYKADMGIIAMDGNTALHHAASGGFADCCKFLGQRGCNPIWKNIKTMTPKDVAKEGGFKAAKKELGKAMRRYKKYSKPGVKNPNPQWSITLHDWSCEHQLYLRESFAMLSKGDGTVTKEDFVSILKAKRAPVSEEELNSIIHLHEIGRRDNINTEEFLKGCKYLQKAFLLSAYAPKKKERKKGKEKIGKEKKGKSTLPMPICMMPNHLISHREDSGLPNFMIDDSGWYVDKLERVYTHINFGTKARDIESLKRAFAEGVPVDVKDIFYKTPLISACAHGNMDTVKFLLEKGAHVNVSDNFMWTPLHHACHGGQKDIAELLLNHGAKIDAVALGGSTPLMRAVERGSLDCAHLLIKSGAKLEIANKKGENVLDLAKAYADCTLIDMIQEKLDSLSKPKKKWWSKGRGKMEGK
ncbi:ankyrin repeat and EF-hand domain-containing protein 1-like [Mixophyes fleayi]|uniref:ankyrin repeat and EF-hand domain-containing protein 1-like n=1 Tax=Mixophyes fleayi TaxID=3061075 RepID=UPI003F4DA702